MLKPSLQLKVGQQLTMTPQLQQAIRLLQLPALELQAHIRELLETNVMLEPIEETEAQGPLEATEAAESSAAPAPEVEPAAPASSDAQVDVVDEHWGEHSVGPSDGGAWNGEDDDRQQEFADVSGESLQEHLLWQLELARLDRREL